SVPSWNHARAPRHHDQGHTAGGGIIRHTVSVFVCQKNAASACSERLQRASSIATARGRCPARVSRTASVRPLVPAIDPSGAHSDGDALDLPCAIGLIPSQGHLTPPPPHSPPT